jgi:hypothetical protein
MKRKPFVGGARLVRRKVKKLIGSEMNMRKVVADFIKG